MLLPDYHHSDFSMGFRMTELDHLFKKLDANFTAQNAQETTFYFRRFRDKALILVLGLSPAFALTLFI